MTYVFASLLLLAPLYVWRFSIGGLPTNVLMLANFVVIALGLLILMQERDWGRLRVSLVSIGKPLLIAVSAFGLASILSLFIFGINAEKIAQWVVLYAQPLAIFVLYRYFAARDEAAAIRMAAHIKVAAYCVISVAGAIALLQYFTLITLPQEWWGNANEPKRAIAFFAHANAYGLFVTPILAWLIPDVMQRMRNRLQSFYGYIALMAWLVGAAGLFLSLSRGAWFGLAVAVGLYVLVSANKKMIIGFIIAGLVIVGIIATVPNLRYRVLLPFYGEKSAVARLSLWDTGARMIADNPIFGKGVNGFSDNWDQYNTDPNLEHYNFPHNIVLNFWIDLGLLGMLSMIALLAISAVKGFVQRAATDRAMFGVLLMITAIVVHGLIDIPYLKNDLSLVFWLLLAASV